MIVAALCAATVLGAQADYELVWEDDFTGTTLYVSQLWNVDFYGIGCCTTLLYSSCPTYDPARTTLATRPS